MKTKYFIYIILFIVLIVLLFATHTKETRFTKLTDISIDSNSYDFGETTLKDTIYHTFRITNLTETPLIITRILPNCTCTVVENFDKKIYYRNEIFEVDVIYIPKVNHHGIVENIVLIECNAKKGLVTLELKGFVNQ